MHWFLFFGCSSAELYLRVVEWVSSMALLDHRLGPPPAAIPTPEAPSEPPSEPVEGPNRAANGMPQSITYLDFPGFFPLQISVMRVIDRKLEST